MPTDGKRRTQQLEKKLDALQRQLEELRRELQSHKPVPEAKYPNRPDKAVTVNSHYFRIPFKIDGSLQGRVKEVELWVASGRGENWQLHDKAKPSEDAFRYTARADGRYLFQVLVVNQDGKKDPPSPVTCPPGLTVLVLTKPPEIELTMEKEGSTRIVRWVIVSEHVDLTTFKFETRSADDPKDKPWTEIRPEKKKSGTRFFALEKGASREIRLSVQDLAGNVGEATMTLK
jgi:hypothetical protein